ncbi:hypothetical protein [Caballeronia sp. ATUFL_M2_KS44]|uniref:hypothetical protein n=1 Tax=Caballeronia sp. ATUFL_M2_KS44 TaxID=2921767 RepID=UPI002028AFAC|nr:hypothetical protein [Caballeronia sp. ATUFL_M2_KS44]
MHTYVLRHMSIKLAPNQSVRDVVRVVHRNKFQVRDAHLSQCGDAPAFAVLLAAFTGRSEDEPQALRDIESALLH